MLSIPLVFRVLRKRPDGSISSIQGRDMGNFFFSCMSLLTHDWVSTRKDPNCISVVETNRFVTEVAKIGSELAECLSRCTIGGPFVLRAILADGTEILFTATDDRINPPPLMLDA
jgi:hypothetical protein